MSSLFTFNAKLVTTQYSLPVKRRKEGMGGQAGVGGGRGRGGGGGRLRANSSSKQLQFMFSPFALNLIHWGEWMTYL